MKLTDFYYADRHAAGSRMAIMLPSGADSGEWLQVLGPDCDQSVKAGRAYTAAVRAIDESLMPLEKECEALGNYARYNDEREYQLEDISHQFAAEVVIGWSFDEAFSKEAFTLLLGQYRALAEAVVTYHLSSRDALSEK